MRVMTGIAGVLCLVSALICLIATETWAQDQHRSRMNSDGKTEPKTGETAAPAVDHFPFRPISSWVGQRFIFLPGPKASEDSTYDDFSGKVVRKQYQGRIAKVVSAEDFSGRVHVIFEMEDTKDRLRAYAPPNRGTVKGLALVDDLDQARLQWVGKTLQCKEMRIFGYDEQKDVVGSIMIKPYSRVKVVEIAPGWDEERPVRFWLETADGQRGFLDLNLSGTNVLEQTRRQHGFDHYFKLDEPRKPRR
ncbi:MAG TPA: hypothetical protein VJ302_16395 [Blastocatellia bacterium]|nr:hypothetical protein [Blastocatellia bacterium]